ncbi:hypothetical protein KIH39_20865 [Telmatocola sphagniphila]|uniref:Uncharacterized protein n=1 Tax=Telmatocola sphagniphila TaxID=1123043 RepID=A0A8E6B4H3_9BACT|nr:hypothetical protein [Telmatocola sphagniphila]QVL31274.1 hypothetical protein KIH39_20865 [Telmatocola sphagniphila]
MKIPLPKNRSLRWGLFFSLLCFGFYLSLALYRWKIGRDSARELQEIVERLNREDPGWDWESFVNRPWTIPDDKNSFTILKQIFIAPKFKILEIDPNIHDWRILPEKMPPEVCEWVSTYLNDRREAVELCRKLVDYPEGRHRIQYSEDIISTLLPTVQDTRVVASLLQWDIRMQSQLGNFDTCVQDLRAMRNAARSFGDEGFLIAALVRIAIDTIFCQSLQEMLSQGETTEAQLALLQKELAEELADEFPYRSLRCERAIMFYMVKYFGENLGLNKQSLRVLNGLAGPSPNEPNQFQSALLTFRYPPYAKADQAYALKMMTAYMEAYRLPLEQRNQKFEELDESFKVSRGMFQAKTLLTNLLFPSVSKIYQRSEPRRKALLRCTLLSIASERFRLANKRWPKSLEELVPKFIEKIDVDPYTETPLKFLTLRDGIVIYSVGEDRLDDGGAVLPNQNPNFERGQYAQGSNGLSKDIGFRLWNTEKRGR